MWDEESFSTSSFSADTWLFSVVSAVRSYLRSLFVHEKDEIVVLRESESSVSIVTYR